MAIKSNAVHDKNQLAKVIPSKSQILSASLAGHSHKATVQTTYYHIEETLTNLAIRVEFA